MFNGLQEICQKRVFRTEDVQIIVNNFLRLTHFNVRILTYAYDNFLTFLRTYKIESDLFLMITMLFYLSISNTIFIIFVSRFLLQENTTNLKSGLS
jgi:hypothetical protein